MIRAMDYGEGTFTKDTQKYTGRIVFDTKVHLVGESDYVETYIAPEAIALLRLRRGILEFTMSPSVVRAYTARVRGSPGQMRRLARDLALRLGMRKRFLRSEWIGTPFTR